MHDNNKESSETVFDEISTLHRGVQSPANMFALLSFAGRPFLSNKPIDFCWTALFAQRERRKSKSDTHRNAPVSAKAKRVDSIRLQSHKTAFWPTMWAVYRAFPWRMRAQMLSTHVGFVRACAIIRLGAHAHVHTVFLDNELCLLALRSPLLLWSLNRVLQHGVYVVSRRSFQSTSMDVLANWCVHVSALKTPVRPCNHRIAHFVIRLWQ